MRNKLSYLSTLIVLFFISCSTTQNHDEAKISKMIDDWHLAASEANIDNYFGLMSEDAIYIGTDASERWTKEEFYGFSEPYFSKGKAWDFKPYDRKIYYSKDRQAIWFDELLKTWMGICRGSGVIVLENGEYKISHYHLSVTIKNEKMDDFLKIEQ